jgi:galactokinase
MKEIIVEHNSEFEASVEALVTVPGIYTFIGEFADYCKGYTLLGASRATLEVAISRRPDQSVRLFMAPQKDRKRFTLQNVKYRKEDRWANYVKGVVSILNNRNYTTTGFNITLNGELLMQEGAIVNSALTLGVTLALKALFFPELTKEECATIAYSALSSFAQENCRLLLFLAMLQTDDKSLLLYDLANLSFERLEYDLHDKEHSFIIVESQISPQALREELALKREESKVAFESLRKVFPTGMLRDISSQEIKESGSLLTEEEKRACLYVLSESRLAKEAGRLLAQKDMVMYGKTLSRVQAGLRDVFEVTCPEIDWLTKRANEISGSLGATMITTGSSGTILVLINYKSIEHYAARMEAYEHIFGFKPTWQSYVPAPKLKIDSYQ